jgi:hypothetical protein
MTSLADVVREHAPSYLARYREAMPDSHARALQAITDCRTAALGAELTVCDHCQATHLLFHSCRHRACPRCGLDTTAQWIERHQRAILPVPYFHVVFTLPAELRRLVRSHQRVLLDVLFRAAFDSLAALASDPRYLGAQIGAIAVLHTWTRVLEWHPHIHMIVPGGGVAPDGRTWKTIRRPGRADFLVPVRALAKYFRGRFLHLARRALPGVPFPEIPWGKSWVVYAKRSSQAKPDRLLHYLARYVHRTALTEKRLLASDNGSVTFTYRDSRDGKRKVMSLGGAEFLRRFLQHVPPRGFHRVRTFGLLHPHHRRTISRLQLLLDASPPPPPDPNNLPLVPAPRPPGHTTIRCPSCHKGTLRIIARLTPLQALAYQAQQSSLVALARPPP